MILGVIADTHGLLRPEAVAALRGADQLLHAGDIGSPEVLAALRAIAPVTVVRGNNDRASWAHELPETVLVELGGARLYMLHDLKTLALDPKTSGIGAVIAGHSHRPVNAVREGVLYFNPGSAGPRRFRLPVSVGRLRIQDGRVTGEVLLLSPA